MSVATPHAEDEPTGVIGAGERAGTAVPMVGGAVGSDRCVECDAQLAPDQRYCVECGTRRGTLRFALRPAAATAAASSPSEPSTARPGAAWSRVTVLALIAALLLAGGVGVLIGHFTSSASTVHVYVTGAGTSSTGSGTTGGSGSTGTTGGSGKGASSSGKGASSSSGGSTIKPGSKCSAGTPGCQNGKETGNFFGS